MSNPKPAEAMVAWAVTEKERRAAVLSGQPYQNYETSCYYRLLNRIDTHYIEVIIGRKDQDERYHTDIRATNFTYIGDFYKREKVYFTFDRITFYQLIEIYPAHPQPLRFMLKRMEAGPVSIKDRAFMIMPFKPETNAFYTSVIKPFLKEKHNIDIYRADDFRDNDIIIETIYHQIEDSEFIIADITNENKNAFYELGYAAAMRKEIITIQEKSVQQLFFDRTHIRSIFYDKNEIDKFQFDLYSTIQSIRTRQ